MANELNKTQQESLKLYEHAYRAFAECTEPKIPQSLMIECRVTYDAALDYAGCTREQCAEIRRGVDLALALDAYRDAWRFRRPENYEPEQKAHEARQLGATEEQLAKARAGAEGAN